MSVRRTGHLPDHPEVVKRRAQMHLHPHFAGMAERAAAGLPMQTTNRSKLMPSQGGPGVNDQDGLGACEGFAHGAGGTLVLAGQGKSQGLIDPVLLYLGALMVDSTLQPDGTLSKCQDVGTMPSSILTAWQTFGAGLAANDSRFFPASRQTLYKDPGDDASELLLPTMEQLRQASPYRFNGAYFTAAAGPQKVLQLMMALAHGFPVSDAIPASGPEFQGYSSGVLGALSGPIDHANLILDYTWTGTAEQLASFVTALQQGSLSEMQSLQGSLEVVALNSWGLGWGEADQVSTASGGTYRANINYLTQAEDLCVLDLSPAA